MIPNFWLDFKSRVMKKSPQKSVILERQTNRKVENLEKQKKVEQG